MEYREWGYGRDPRDRVTAQSPWSDAGDPADEDPHGEPRPRSDQSTSWDATDRWAADRGPDSVDNRYQSDGRYPADDREPGPTTGAWTYGHHTGSWETTDSAWLPQQRQGSPDDEQYPPAARWGQVLDHDDWYEHPPAAGVPAPRRSVDGAHRSRVDDEDDEDEDDEPERGYLPAILLTAAWYAGPVLLYLIWSVTLAGAPSPNCVDAAGEPCVSARADALGTLSDGLPRLAAAFSLSLVVALIIRLANGSWRAVTVGFAAAVVGAGIATVAFSFLGAAPSG